MEHGAGTDQGDQVRAVDCPPAGLCASRTIDAQLVDTTTGRVVGNILTPIPVTLDGRSHSVSIPMEDIAHTVADGDSLVLQITSSASSFGDFVAFGVVDVSAVTVESLIRP